MKLHLPHRLQAAVMAALASVCFTTLSSATLAAEHASMDPTLIQQQKHEEQISRGEIGITETGAMELEDNVAWRTTGNGRTEGISAPFSLDSDIVDAVLAEDDALATPAQQENTTVPAATQQTEETAFITDDGLAAFNSAARSFSVGTATPAPSASSMDLAPQQEEDSDTEGIDTKSADSATTPAPGISYFGYSAPRPAFLAAAGIPGSMPSINSLTSADTTEPGGLYWKGDKDGKGTWDIGTSKDWTDFLGQEQLPFVDGYHVVFGAWIAKDATVDLRDTVTVASFSVLGADVTISGEQGTSITTEKLLIGENGFLKTTVAVSANEVEMGQGDQAEAGLPSTWNVEMPGEFSATISGSGNLNKVGADKTLILTGTNSSFRGSITVYEGAIKAGSDTALGNGSTTLWGADTTLILGANVTTGGLTMQDGATLKFNTHSSLTLTSSLGIDTDASAVYFDFTGYDFTATDSAINLISVKDFDSGLLDSVIKLQFDDNHTGSLSYKDNWIVLTLKNFENYWKGGNGNWSDTAWYSAEDRTGDARAYKNGNVYFTADSTVTVDTDATVATMTLGSGTNVVLTATGHTLTANSIQGAGANLTLNGGTASIAANSTVGSLNGTSALNIANEATLTVGGTKESTYSGAISGAGSLVHNGGSTMTLSGANSNFTGSILVTGDGSVLKLGGNNAWGAANTESSSTRTITAANGGTLDVNGQNPAAGAYKVTLRNNGTLANTGESTVQLSALSVEGTNATAYVDATAALSLQGSLALNGNTLAKKGSEAFTLTGTTVSGNGTLRVDAGNLEIGASPVSAGSAKLELNGGNLVFNDAASSLTIAGITSTQQGGAIQGTNATITLNPGAGQAYTFTGQIENSPNLVKQGDGTQDFNLTDQVTTLGTINVQAGQLNMYGTGYLTIAGNVTVQNGDFRVSNALGVTLGDTVLNSGGHLDLGTTIHTSSFSTNGGTLTFAGGTTDSNADMMLNSENGISIGTGTVIDLANISYRRDMAEQTIYLGSYWGTLNVLDGQNAYTYINGRNSEAKYTLKSDDNNHLILFIEQTVGNWDDHLVRYSHATTGGTAVEYDKYAYSQDGTVEFNAAKSSAGKMDVYSGNTVSVNSNTTFVVEEGQTVNLGKNIAGQGTICKEGRGTLSMLINENDGNYTQISQNHFFGPVKVLEGTLIAEAKSALGASKDYAAEISVAKDALLVLEKDEKRAAKISIPNGLSTETSDRSVKVSADDKENATLSNVQLSLKDGITVYDGKDGARGLIQAYSVELVHVGDARDELVVSVTDIIATTFAVDGHGVIDNATVHASQTITAYASNFGESSLQVRNNSILLLDAQANPNPEHEAKGFAENVVVDKTSKINAIDQEGRADSAVFTISRENHVSIADKGNGGVATRAHDAENKTIKYTSDQLDGLTLGSSWYTDGQSLDIHVEDTDMPESLLGYSFTLTLTHFDSSIVFTGMDEYYDAETGYWDLTKANLSLYIPQYDGTEWQNLVARAQGKFDQETGHTVIVFSNFEIGTPEPSTGTLGLLALAALCARRRRKA